MEVMNDRNLSVRSTADQAAQVRDQARDIVFCSWARHFTFTGV